MEQALRLRGPRLGHMLDHVDVFACPACRGDLSISGDAITCSRCRIRYAVEDGIPLLFLANEWDASRADVTDVVREFYEETPFPNYDGFESVGDLIERAQRGVFARLLNEQIPFNTRILEIGCGTGQLSNFLAVAQRVVFGTDMCLNSLALAQEFKERCGLERAGFYQMNLFRPAFKEESFPLVICTGVLHHTSNPYAGFQCISRLVKRGGYILLGLYNRYGRAATDIRRMIFKLCGDRFTFLDPRLRGTDIGDLKKLTWFRDQYKNPHESKHTIGEVLRWFDETGFDFVNSVPKLKAFETFSEGEKLFRPNPRGNWVDRFVTQFCLSFTGSREGGFFVMIGRKRN